MRKFKTKIEIILEGELPEEDFKDTLKELKENVQSILQKQSDNLTLLTYE